MTTVTHETAVEATPEITAENKAMLAALLDKVVSTTVPFNQLEDVEDNVRFRSPLRGIPELAENLYALGQLQNLVVYELPGKDKSKRYGVAAGRRRRCGFEHLVNAGRIPADFPVAVKIVSQSVARMISLAENNQRQSMQPYEQIPAYRDLVAEGRSKEFIASVYGVPVAQVSRMLKLANASPRLLALLAEDRISLEQLAALTLADTHELQEQVWDAARVDWQRNPNNLRQAITKAEIPASNPLVKLVGLDAYEAAGGFVREDIFSSNNSGYITNPELLHSLVAERLQEKADEVTAQGWSWVNVIAGDYSYSEREKYGRAPSELREASEAELLQLDTLNQQLEELELALEDMADDEDENELSDAYQEAEAKRDELAAQIEAIREGMRLPVDKANCGAVIYIDGAGQLVVLEGLKTQEELKARQRAEQKAQAAASGQPQAAKAIHSEKLVTKMTAHRTAAVQAELMQQPHVALAMMAHRMAAIVFCSRYYSPSVLKVDRSRELADLPRKDETIEQSPAWATRTAAEELWRSKLPEGFEDDLEWILAWPQEEVLGLLAFCVAVNIDGVIGRERVTQLDQLAKAVSLDMTQYWQPTVDNYLMHVNKLRLQQIVAHEVSNEAALQLTPMKKAEAAGRTEALLAGKGWLPKVLGGAI
ncbi:chromosome partitioning protein ParB [Xenophilus sp. AP218F]|nr:chromosome partitioning protein ParB [Xenophilus sp. AP218F]